MTFILTIYKENFCLFSILLFDNFFFFLHDKEDGDKLGGILRFYFVKIVTFLLEFEKNIIWILATSKKKQINLAFWLLRLRLKAN